MQGVKKIKKTGKTKNEKIRAEVTVYRGGFDRFFLILILIMVCAGTVMIFSASYVKGRLVHDDKDSFVYVKNQLRMAGICIFFMTVMLAVTSFMDCALLIKFLKRAAVPVAAGVFVLNALTPAIGVTINGATRWLVIAGWRFQPSELLKLAAVLFFALYIDKMDKKMHRFKYGIGIPFGIILSILGIMFLQSHISGLIIICMIIIIMIFIGGASRAVIGGLMGVCAAGIVWALIFKQQAIAAAKIVLGSRAGRIVSWLDPESDPMRSGLQIIQSMYAIASGGISGLGFGQSRQKYLYLPEPQTDFIFSIIAEELGFIGSVLIIGLFVLLIWRGIIIAYRAPDKFSAFVVLGITIKIAVQFILNLFVVTNLIPNTGVPLPFFSYGGTSLVVLLMETGIILCISRYSYQEKI